MALTAGPAAGLADVFGYLDQIHVGIRHTRAQRIFFIGPRGIVAYETVNPGHVGKVKGSIRPSVAGMTTGATRPVAGHVYEKVVNGFGGLAQVDPLFLTLGED